MPHLSKRFAQIFAEIKEPWIVFKPTHGLRRLLQKFQPKPPKIAKLKTSWGGFIWCDSQKQLGRNIHWRGIFDIVVSEVLVRLLEPGTIFVDAGANVGYMSVLAARVVKAQGSVISFEPNPHIIPNLQQNAALSAADPRNAPIQVVQAALGSAPGEAMLFAPEDYTANDAIAHINASNLGDKPISLVPIKTLDTEMPAQRIKILKLDVEGHELEVLKGAAAMLAAHRVETVVFEDHAINESPVPDYLARFGYKVFSLKYSLRGLHIEVLDATSGISNPGLKSDGSPSYLATILSPQALQSKLTGKGWRCLSPAL